MSLLSPRSMSTDPGGAETWPCERTEAAWQNARNEKEFVSFSSLVYHMLGSGLTGRRNLSGMSVNLEVLNDRSYLHIAGVAGRARSFGGASVMRCICS